MPEDLPKGFFMGRQRMEAEEIFQIASVFEKLGVKKIRLTGGEPLVRRDAKDIMLMLAKLPVELCITTNGILVDDYLETFFKAGIRSINVSLDSLEEENFTGITGRNYFKKVFSNIMLLLQNNFHVKLNMVVMRGVNEKEIPAFINLTQDNPLHVRFVEYMPFDGNRWEKQKVFSEMEILELAEQYFLFEKIQDRKNDTTRYYHVNGSKGTFGIISTMTNPFCSGCNRLRLLSDGKLKNCLFSNGETDLLTPLRSGEDIEPLIMRCVIEKKSERGGQISPTLANVGAESIRNLSMVAIGG
jgi:cyclic pyranopterin phosphate synthase